MIQLYLTLSNIQHLETLKAVKETSCHFSREHESTQATAFWAFETCVWRCWKRIKRFQNFTSLASCYFAQTISNLQSPNLQAQVEEVRKGDLFVETLGERSLQDVVRVILCAVYTPEITCSIQKQSNIDNIHILYFYVCNYILFQR